MTTAYSSLLGLALPVQGELAGQWGDTVNDYITKYLDASIAGSLSITADVTLTKTTGTTLGATSSQYAILTCSPSSVNIVVTAPAAYKIYVVNNTSASYTVTIRGATPTSGVVLAALEKAVVAWNGSDFFKVATSATDGVSTFSAGSTGLTPSSATAGAVTLAGTLAVANGGTGLTAGTSGGVLAYTATGTLASSSALAASALVIGGGAGAAPSTTTTGTGVVTALGVNTGSAGAFVVNGGALGTPSSGTVTNLTGTASININGTVGATTATTGAFTTLSATKAAAGNVITWTNGGATPVAGALYSGASNIYFGGSAGNDGFYIAPGTNVECYVNGVSRLNLTATGLNSTAIGATTATTGAFTTVGASGLITRTSTVNADNVALNATTAGTGSNMIRLANTGTNLWFGIDNAAGTAFWNSGGIANSINIESSTAIQMGVNFNNPNFTLTSTGLNSTVIGATTPAAGSFTTLSASGAMNITGGNWLQFYSTNTLYSSSGIGFFLQAPDVSTTPLTIRGGGGATWATVSSTGLAVTGTLSASGQSSFGGALQITGAGVPASGAGMELAGSVSASSITSFNRSLGTYLSQNFNALDYSFATSSTERMRLTSTGLAVTGTLSATGDLLVGVASGTLNTISKSVVQGTAVALIGSTYYGAVTDYPTAYFSSVGASSWNGAAAAFNIANHTITLRSINASGTINASGADYAEYENNNGLTIAKGSIVGFKADGTLTATFLEAIRFGIKSTNPSYVGGDTWGSDDALGVAKPTYQSDDFDELLEASRAKVDRIAYSGKVPCNVTGATPGGYIIAVENAGAIAGEFVADPDFAQYKKAVGRVNRILPDGRAEVAIIIH